MFVSQQLRLALAILVAIISIGLIFFVYKHNKRTLLSHIFLTVNVSLLGWLVSVFFALHSSFSAYSLLFPRISMACAVGINTGIFLLGYFLAYHRLPKKNLMIGIVIMVVVLVPLTLSPYIFRNATIGETSITATQTGWGMLLFSAYAFFCTFDNSCCICASERACYPTKDWRTTQLYTQNFL